MRSTFVKIKEGMKEKKRIKKNIRVGYFVKAKVGEMKKNAREGRSRRIRKEVVGCVQNLLVKNKFLVQF